MADYRDMLVQLRTELANLEIRRQQIHAAIVSLERLIGQGSIKVEIDPKNPTPFREMTYGDAAQQLLTKYGPLSTRELAELILQGGASTKSRNFVATLYSLLYKDGRFALRERKCHLNATDRGEREAA